MQIARRKLLAGPCLGSQLRLQRFSASCLPRAAKYADPHCRAPRGACDGLNLVSPADDPAFVAARVPELRVAAGGENAGRCWQTDPCLTSISSSSIGCSAARDLSSRQLAFGPRRRNYRCQSKPLCCNGYDGPWRRRRTVADARRLGMVFALFAPVRCPGRFVRRENGMRERKRQRRICPMERGRCHPRPR